MDRPLTPTGTVTPTRPDRKVFNVIVDATALISGVKRNTRDGVKKWIDNGSIRLVVPLHTLKQLNTLRETRVDRFGQDAKDTLVWLDQITEQQDIVTGGWVKIQEGHEEYQTWEEVEHFLLPKTLLSHVESEATGHGSIADDVDKLHIDDSTASVSSKNSDDLRPVTPSSPDSAFSATSPGILVSSPYKNASKSANGHRKKNSSVSMAGSQVSMTSADNGEVRIPRSLQPLFNHIMWRINHTQSLDAEQGLGSYILLTNDHLKQSIAHRFGIRVKRLEQLRDIIAREDRDVKNRQTVLKKESDSPAGSLLKPTDSIALHRPQSRGSTQHTTPKQRIFDPNTFDRAPSPAAQTPGPSQGKAPLFAPTGPSGRGGSLRGRGGRGGFPAAAARGNFAQSQSTRGSLPFAPPRSPQDLNRPIDPDSYERPRGGRGGLARGGRKLWEPN